MSVEDQFTSIQWDRDEVEDNAVKVEETIPEEENTEHETKESNTEVDDKESEEKDKSSTPDISNDFIMNDASSDKPDEVDHTSEQPIDDNNNVTDKVPTVESHKVNPYEAYFIESTVSSPIRDLDSSSKPYISYLITTTSDNPALIKFAADKTVDKVEFKVRRRYGDFRTLHECLVNDFPQVMVPPLPSKLNFKYLTGDTFSTEFVHKRLHSLDRFIKFIIRHAALSQSSIFHLFVSESTDWATFTKNLKSKGDGGDESAGFVNKVVNDDLITETVMNFLTPSKHKRESNKDILDINDKLKKLYENLTKLDRIFSKLNKKNSDLSLDYEQFLNQINKLASLQVDNGNNDPNYNEEEQGDKKDNNNPTELEISNNFKIFAESLSFYLKSWSNLHHYIDESFLVSLKDCSKYIISLTNLIELQHNKSIDLQVLQDYLNKAKTELASAGNIQRSNSPHYTPPVPLSNNSGIVNNTTQLIKDTLSTSATSQIGSSSTENKIKKLQAKVDQLESEINIQTNVVIELTNKIVHEEYPNWDKFNKTELKETMLGLCNEEVKFYKGLIENWNDVEAKLLKRLDELE